MRIVNMTFIKSFLSRTHLFDCFQCNFSLIEINEKSYNGPQIILDKTTGNYFLKITFEKEDLFKYKRTIDFHIVIYEKNAFTF